MSKPWFSDTEIIRQIDTGDHWLTPMGVTAKTVSFGFPDNVSWALPVTDNPYWIDYVSGFSPLTPAQRSIATFAMQLWDDVTALTLRPAAYGGVADIRLSKTEMPYNGAAYYHNGQTVSDDTDFNQIEAGSVWLTSRIDPVVGTWDFKTVLHEIGHALGLSHPGKYNAAVGVEITYETHAEYAQDTFIYTLMSYFDESVPHPKYGEPWASWFKNGVWHAPETPMMDDILTLQSIYGVDTTTRTGDTIYGFNSTADRWIYNFALNPTPVLTIWDAGGNDTLDVSGFSDRQWVDLRPGASSDIGGMTWNVAIARNVFIENATAGYGNDTIHGNDVANALRGGGGNDRISGYAGNDTVDGGTGADTLDGGSGNDTYFVKIAGRYRHRGAGQRHRHALYVDLDRQTLRQRRQPRLHRKGRVHRYGERTRQQHCRRIRQRPAERVWRP